MATNFGTKIAITGFVWTIATRQLVIEGVWVVSQQNADIADTLQLRDVAMATIFVYGVYISATWRIRLNHPCVVAMWPYAKSNMVQLHLYWCLCVSRYVFFHLCWCCCSMQPMRILITGPPSCGKTTVIEQLCAYFKLHHVKIKDVIDDAIAKRVNNIHQLLAVYLP